MPSYSYPKLELKYCERCGGLWLRPQGSETVYCTRCAEAIAELPPPVRGGSSGAVQAACAAVVMFFPALLNLAECMGGVCA